MIRRNFRYDYLFWIGIFISILCYIICSYTLLQSTHLFEMIRDADSNLTDIHLCLMQAYPAAMQRAANFLSSSINTRLLQPGATTQDIITQYLSLLSALRVLDPSSVMLQIISTPIITYLNSRSDTVRCITSLYYATFLHKHSLQMKCDINALTQDPEGVLQFFNSLPDFCQEILLADSAPAVPTLENKSAKTLPFATFLWHPEVFCIWKLWIIFSHAISPLRLHPHRFLNESLFHIFVKISFAELIIYLNFVTW